VAGVVALVAGMIWGSKLGVQFSLTHVALRALPVVILGGLTSVPGAIIGGLIIGVGEKLSEVYLGPMWAAASRSGLPMCWRWCSCCSGRRACSAKRSLTRVKLLRVDLRRPTPDLSQKPCSTEKTASSRPPTAPTSRSSRSCRTAWPCWLLLASGGLRGAAAGQRLHVPAILIPFLIMSLAALGVNILVGYCGQISLGSGAFMAVGAYAAYNFFMRI
jgi:ABC-type branched-subunit amino acid transport system permease subunit